MVGSFSFTGLMPYDPSSCLINQLEMTILQEAITTSNYQSANKF